MDVFEAVFHILYKIFRFFFLQLIFEFIIEYLIRGAGYCVVWFYRFGRSVDFESSEVLYCGITVWITVIMLMIYWLIL